jgi:NADPH:quinone reductase-like Zn-dependent oxidoreductase
VHLSRHFARYPFDLFAPGVIMKAIGFNRFGSIEVLETLEIPKPTVTPDSVLVRVAAAGINPADWRLREGQFRFFMSKERPFIPGADIAGVVEAVGENVRRFVPGDSVYAMLSTAKGGGYAEYALVPQESLALVPSNITLAEAAAIPLTALTALQALRDKAHLKAGEHALIIGASGGVGTFATQMAKAMGAKVTAVSSGRNRELVRSVGADDMIDYTQEDLSARNLKYDVIFETVNAYPFKQLPPLLSSKGRVITVNPGAALLPKWLKRLTGQTQLDGVFVQAKGDDLAMISDWIATGKVRPIIDQCYPLVNVAEAHRYSETERVRGKLVLVVDEQLATMSAGLVSTR